MYVYIRMYAGFVCTYAHDQQMCTNYSHETIAVIILVTYAVSCVQYSDQTLD